ncbi:MAG: PHP domain-containing protein [Spirochaetaceae bacterium]|nr:PHP domain-containing protein [Spirochaetaceae bacterium]
MIVTFDLHNHSCLSPCSSLEMDPESMAGLAAARRIAVLGISDHNSALNGPAFALACARRGIVPFFGIELNPIEEAHLLVLFPDPLAALAFSDRVQGLLPPVSLDAEKMGDQVVVDAEGGIAAIPETWLGSALERSFDALAQDGARSGALVIPAHVDRPVMSVFSQLGFLPAGPYDAVEAVGSSPETSLTGGCCVISGSDAHVPVHVGRRVSTIEVPEDRFERVQKALAAMASLYDAKNNGEEVPVAAATGLAASDATETEALIDSESPAGSGVSSEIPGLAALIDFLATSYPFEEARMFFEAFRTALRQHRAWSAHARHGSVTPPM